MSTAKGWTAVRKQFRVLNSLLVGAALLLPTTSLRAAETVPSPESVVVPLESRELGSGVVALGLSVTSRNDPFRKEPTPLPRGVRRGVFTLGAAAVQTMPFLWDYSQGRLYLDLNRNDDLSDDSDGIFSCAASFRRSDYQQFNGILLDFPVGSSRQPLRFDLSLYAFGQLGGSISLRSYWSGRAELQGREWELGFVFVPGWLNQDPAQQGELLLRPWAARNEAFATTDGTLRTFSCGSNLFFTGQAFRLERNIGTGTPPTLEIVLTPEETALGEIEFTGRYVQRAVLPQGPWTVVLDQPAGKVAVPLGEYGEPLVTLRNGDTTARLEQIWQGLGGPRNPFVVEADKTAEVTTGGPLTNSVTVLRRGRSINLQYRLVGADGETYQPLRQDPNDPPRFSVWLDDRQIGSGEFEFG